MRLQGQGQDYKVTARLSGDPDLIVMLASFSQGFQDADVAPSPKIKSTYKTKISVDGDLSQSRRGMTITVRRR